jgi:alpha-L-fucosidase
MSIDYTYIYISGKVIGRKWENAMTIDKYSWGYRRNARALDVYSIQNLITQLVETVSFGGKQLYTDTQYTITL